MAENWIVELAEEIRERYDLYLGEEGKWEHEFPKLCHIILSHARVIDAERLAKQISGMSMYWELDDAGHTTGIQTTVISEEDALELITSNLDLSITWANTEGPTEGRQCAAEYCGLRALVSENVHTKQWHWSIFGWNGEIVGAWVKSQELAQAACVDALKRIVTGGKG